MSGLLLNITGDGKGKTTSAVGIVVRALGYGQHVVVFQFVKNQETGEKLFFEHLNLPNLKFKQLGDGFSWTDHDHKKAAETGWKEVLPYLQGKVSCDLLVLDELNIALRCGWLPMTDVVEALKNRTPELNVIVTGRTALEPLLSACDLVSEIKNIKHPFDRGIPARKGIDF